MDAQRPEPGSTDIIGEAMAAVTGGLERIVDGSPRAIPASAHDKAIKFLANIPARVEKALEGATEGESGRETPEGDYKEMIRAFSDPKLKPSPEMRLKLVDKLDKAFAAPYLLWFDRAYAAAAGIIPRRTWDTIFGPRPGMPSSSELGTWWRAWDVARDPMVVIDRIADGTLITDEVDALGMFYPALRDRMRQATLLALASLGAKNGEDWLPADVTQRTVECLLNFSPLSPELAAKLQNAAAAARQGEQDRVNEGMVNGPVIDGPKLETQTQRIAER